MRTFLLAIALLLVPGVACAQQSGTAPRPSAPSNPVATAGNPSPAPAVATDVGHLHVYRQRRYVGGALAPSIYVDQKRIARVGNGRRLTIRLTPGSHAISSDDKSSAIDLDVKAGGDYYVRVDEVPGAFKGHGRLTLVMAEQGTAEYKKAKPIEEDRKVDKKLIEDDSTAAPPKS